MALNDFLGVVFEVADVVVLLNQRDLHETNLLLRAGILSCGPERFYPDEETPRTHLFAIYNQL